MAPRSHKSSKIALVTGGARRIGRALAIDLAAAGWRVGVHYRGAKEAAEEVVAHISRAGGQAVSIAADIANPRDLECLMERAKDALGGPPTCLINNASLFEQDAATTATIDSWDRHQATNLRAPVFLAQALHRLLPEGAAGNVINIIDQRVLRLTPDYFSYTIAKAGLWAATQTLAQALAPRIRVNAIGPGPVLKNTDQTEAEFAAEASSTPLGRGASPDEIAAAVRFILASPAMTGQLIVLDGGQHLEWRTDPACAEIPPTTPIPTSKEP